MNQVTESFTSKLLQKNLKTSKKINLSLKVVDGAISMKRLQRMHFYMDVNKQLDRSFNKNLNSSNENAKTNSWMINGEEQQRGAVTLRLFTWNRWRERLMEHETNNLNKLFD